MFERRRNEEKDKLRELPAAEKFCESAGKGGNLAVKRGQKALEIEMGGEVKGKCGRTCCKPWTV